MNKGIEKSGGGWNVPYINSDLLNLRIKGYAPIYRGGCMGIVPKENSFVLLYEDDDHYFDGILLEQEDLIDYLKIVEKLKNGCKVKINFLECTTKCTYTPNKSTFFSTNFSLGRFKVGIKERGQSAPLVSIIFGDDVDKFDISWASERYDVCYKALNKLPQ